jgi:two-component system OmpR family sensor kinase
MRRDNPALRLGLQTGLLVVAVLAVLGTLIFVLYERAADQAANALLRDTTANIDAPSESPPDVRVVVVTASGQRMSANMPAGFPDQAAIAAVQRDGRTRQATVQRHGHDFAVRTQKVNGRVTQAIYDRHERDEERARILTALLLAGAVGVLLAMLVATFMARRAMAPLNQSLAMQRRFVADASHELRTPLTLLSTRVQLAVRRARQRDGRMSEADLRGVLSDTGRLTDILEELLVAADTGTSPRELIDLTALVDECVDAARALAHERDIALGAGRGEAVKVLGVEAALRRAVTALVDNALDHATSRVDVDVLHTARTAAVRVSDDGPGIPEDARNGIFQRFTSSRPMDEEGRRHYGIGLALVADVAAAHDGRVDAGSPDEGTGAVLTLTLPRRR